MRPRRFADLTGFNYRTVVGWAKGRPIPKVFEDSIRKSMDLLLVRGYRPEVILTGLKKRVAHRAPKSGKYVGPDVQFKRLDRELKEAFPVRHIGE